MSEVRELTFADYCVGTKSSVGVIRFIFGQSDDAIVFEDEEGRVQWEVTNLAAHHIEVHQKFDRLYARVQSAISKDNQGSLIAELAQALFRGLVEPVPTRALTHFDDVSGRIVQEALVRARIYYVGCSTGAAFFVAGGLLANQLIPPEGARVLIGAAAGALGAWTSVLQRSSRLEIGPFDPPHYQAFQGVTRTFLGGVFGAFLVAGSNAGIIASFAKDNLWGMAVAAFVAGLSERYIPEMLRNLEQSRSQSNNADRLMVVE